MTLSVPVTTDYLVEMKRQGEKIVVLTSYDASMTAHCEEAGVEVLLVGDSLGMVVQGNDSTLPVTVEHMVYHTEAVCRSASRSLIVADMPYHSYETDTQALETARALVKAGASVVKLEGAGDMLRRVEHITQYGISVCGHLGLLPQSIEELGGYRVQGRTEEAAQQILSDAIALEKAGACMLVLECIPAELASNISQSVTIPVIGIGAGVDCDGQVLVIYDLLGLTPGKRPRFSKDFLTGQKDGIIGAIKAYVNAVKDKTFPAEEHSFH